MDRPLLCSSAKGGEHDGLLDAAQLLDVYGPRGIDFVVDSGTQVAEDSTVVDMTAAPPALVRQGKGDASWLEY